MKFLTQKATLSTLAIILSCTACSVPDWIGGKEAQTKFEGERITLLEQSSTISVDGAIANQRVELPQPRRNTRWYKSSGQHPLTEPNPRSPWELKSHMVIDTGEGSNNDSYPITQQPVIAEDKIFMMDAAGNVSAYNVDNTTSTPVWKTLIDVPEEKENFGQGGLAYDQGVIYVNTGYTTIVALNSKTGELIWKKTLASSIRSAPDARNGQLFVQTLDNKLYSLSAYDGTIQWIHSGIEKELTQLGAASPLALGEAVVASYSSGGLFNLRASNGKQIWTDSLASSGLSSFNVLTDIDATPVVSEGRLYAASVAGSISSFELFSGARVWERRFASSGNLWIAGNFLYAKSEQADIAAFYTVNGGVKWVVSLPRFKDLEEQTGRINWSGPVLSGSRLLVVGSHGKMLAISPLSGEIMQEYDVAEDVYTVPVSAYGNIYLFDNDAQLHIYSGPMKQPTIDDFITSKPHSIVTDVEHDVEENPIHEAAGAIGEFFSGFLKRFKAEPEDEAQPDEKP